MKIKDIIKTSALLLGREDVSAYLESASDAGEDTLSAVKVLTDLANIVVSELASSYIPNVYVEEVVSEGGRVYYSRLSKTPLKILAVTDLDGNAVTYTQYPEFIVTESKVKIEYEYLPKTVDINGDVAYEERNVPSRVLAYGVCAEFCITEGSFEKAVMWHKRYVDAIKNIVMPKSSKIKSRSWV